MRDGNKVFLSYAREDLATARRVADELIALDFDVWFDQDALRGGQNWRRAIREAIRQSDYFVVLLSEYSIGKRGTIQLEVAEALDVAREFPPDAVFVVPVRLARVTPAHEALCDLHYVDLFDDWSQGIRSLQLAILGKVAAEDTAAVMSIAEFLAMIAEAARGVAESMHLLAQVQQVTIRGSPTTLTPAFRELVSLVVGRGKRGSPPASEARVEIRQETEWVYVELACLAHPIVTNGAESVVAQRYYLGGFFVSHVQFADQIFQAYGGEILPNTIGHIGGEFRVGCRLKTC